MRQKYKYPAMPDAFTPVLRRRQRVMMAMRALVTDPAVSEAEIARIKQCYLLRREAEVLTFLRRHPFLIEPVLEGIHAVRSIFGADTQVVLEVVADYEYPVYRQLFAYVQVRTGEFRQAYKSLKELDKSWFVPTLKTTKDKLIFDLEVATHV